MALLDVWGRFGSALLGFAFGGAASRSVRPIFELVEQESWNANPNRLLAPNTLAELVATALLELGPARAEAQRQGYTGNRLEALAQLALRTPTLGQAMEARRRDLISEAQYRHALRKAAIEPQYDAAMVALLEVLPPVTDLVRMGVREVFSPAQRAALELDAEFPEAFGDRAERLGLSRQTARDYWAAHWELPSFEQLAQMRFRGELTAAELREALRALDYAPTWRGKLEAIARRIPTITDMVRFAVREVYDDAARAALGIDAEYPSAFTAQAAQHGMSEEHARQYWAAHWRLPSARQGYQMVWRGEMELDELRTLLKALDYPPKWRDRLFNIAFIVPGRIDLKRMLRHGIMDRDEVVAGYQRIGYAPADAELMTQIAEAELDTGPAGETYVTRARSSLFARLRTEYVSRQLGDDEALDGLEAVGVPAVQRARVVDLWRAERDYVRTELTQAQIVKAHKKGLLETAEAHAELVERGLTERDATIRLESG